MIAKLGGVGSVYRAWLLLATLMLCAAGSSAAAHAVLELGGEWRPVGVPDSAGEWTAFAPDRLSLIDRGEHGAHVLLRPRAGRWPTPPFVLVVSDLGLASVALIDPQSAQYRRASALSARLTGVLGVGRVGFLIGTSVPDGGTIELHLPHESVISPPLRFAVQSIDEFQRQQSRWIAFASACFAAMAAMALVATAFGLFLRDRTFLVYSGYVLAYALVMAIQSGYVAHPLGWTWVAEAPRTWGRAATAVSVALACLFAVRFMRLELYAPGWRRVVLGLALAITLALVPSLLPWVSWQSFGRGLINPLLILGGPLLLGAALVAAWRGSRYALFFLAGWVPLLLLTMMTSTQVGGAFADIAWLNDASLAAGAFEAMVLSLGLADRSLQVRRERDRVQELADTDALTGLPNRRHALSRLDAMLHDGRLRQRPLAVMFLDLDHFKRLNDNHGHLAGDEALRITARVLDEGLRDEDLLGRYGGEEFVIALPGSDRATALAVAERLRLAIGQIVLPGVAGDVVMGVSIGLVMRVPGETAESLLARADQAMYQAKEQGRDRVVAA